MSYDTECVSLHYSEWEVNAFKDSDTEVMGIPSVTPQPPALIWPSGIQQMVCIIEHYFPDDFWQAWRGFSQVNTYVTLRGKMGLMLLFDLS